MAVDSQTKRRSALGMVIMALTIAPVPDGTVAAVDREHIIGIYAGIAPATPGVDTTAIHILSMAKVEPNHASDSSDNLLIADTLEVQQELYAGGVSNYAQVIDGVLSFVGTAGKIFGGMHVASELIVSIGGTDPVEIKDASNDGWTVGELNGGVTFPSGGDEHYLTAPKIGKYKVIWTASAHCAGGGTNMHGGVMVANTAIEHNGEDHTHVRNASDDQHMGSIAVVDITSLTGVNAQISLWVSDDNETDVHLTHGNMYIEQVAGT